MSIQLCHIMNQLRTKYRNLLAIISLYLIISFLTNVSNKPYHVTGEYPLSEQHWRSTSKWCLEKNYVISLNSYSLKQGIPWRFCLFLSVTLILFLPNVLNKTYNYKGENQLSVERIGGLMSIKLSHIIDYLQP